MLRRLLSALLLGSTGVLCAAEPAPPPREKIKLGEWRKGDWKKKLLADGGGGEKTEIAVAAGLKWLAEKQKADGTWEFTGTTYVRYTSTATAFALLCFLGAGHAPNDDGTYGKVVASGVAALLTFQDPKTNVFRPPSGGNMYEHAIATLAMVEAYGMSADQKLKEACQNAIDVMVKFQAPRGGWRYDTKRPHSDGDVSITGWVVQSLTAANRYTDLKVPTETLNKASAFLDLCAKGEKKATFTYTPGGRYDRRAPRTASGLCSKIALDGWTANNERLDAGVSELLKHADRLGDNDSYFLYYATRAVYCHGGDAWTKEWNPRLVEWLLPLQSKDGSWPAERPRFYPYISSTGQVGTTCVRLLILETYYRYPPPPAK